MNTKPKPRRKIVKPKPYLQKTAFIPRDQFDLIAWAAVNTFLGLEGGFKKGRNVYLDNSAVPCVSARGTFPTEPSSLGPVSPSMNFKSQLFYNLKLHGLKVKK